MIQKPHAKSILSSKTRIFHKLSLWEPNFSIVVLILNYNRNCVLLLFFPILVHIIRYNLYGMRANGFKIHFARIHTHKLARLTHASICAFYLLIKFAGFVYIHIRYMHWILDATRKTAVFIWRRAAACAFVWLNFRKTLVWFLRTLNQWHMQAKLAVKPLLYFLFHSLSLSLSLTMCANVRACDCICAHIVSMPNINTLQFVEFIFMGYQPIPCDTTCKLCSSIYFVYCITVLHAELSLNQLLAGVQHSISTIRLRAYRIFLLALSP